MKLEELCSLESEAGVIATLIHNPDFAFYSEHLLPGHFTEKTNACVYLAITGLVKKAYPLSTRTISLSFSTLQRQRENSPILSQ